MISNHACVVFSGGGRRSTRLTALLIASLLTACGSDGSTAPGTGSAPPAASDTSAPSVAIASPTSSPTHVTGNTPLALGGTASDNVGVTLVTWSNNRGGNGTASGTTSWSIGGIALLGGTNVITVTARDAAGNIATDTLTVTYNVADTTPPTVASTSPASGATNVSTGTTITVTFSEAMSASSIHAGTFQVSGVSGSVGVNGAIAVFTPSGALADSTGYTVTVLGGANGVRDAAGNALASNYSWSFTTTGALACAGPTVLCVDDTVGATQEYSTIQAAVNVARAGDTVLVYDGRYRGFSIAASGTVSARIVVRAAGGAALIDQVNGRNEGITLSNASHVTVEGFTVTGMPGYGLATHDSSATNPVRGLVIRNNTVSNSGSSNIYLSQVADSLVEGNIARGSIASHGIYLANGGSDNTILRGNRCHDNAKNGIHFNGDSSVGGDGLHTGITVEGNVIHGNTANGIDADGVQDSLFRNNLVYANGRNALRAFRIDSAQGPRNLRVVNNTLLVPSGGGWALKFSEDLGGHVFFNNILLSDNTGTGSISVSNTGFTSNNNALVGRLSYDGESSVVNLGAWQAAGFDAASFTATPAGLFVNPGAADYRLRAGAPAIDAGRASLSGVAAPGTDLSGSARPQGAGFDLGAYEN